nr:hypothetical protein [Nonomuraea sediminis]
MTGASELQAVRTLAASRGAGRPLVLGGFGAEQGAGGARLHALQHRLQVDAVAELAQPGQRLRGGELAVDHVVPGVGPGMVAGGGGQRLDHGVDAPAADHVHARLQPGQVHQAQDLVQLGDPLGVAHAGALGEGLDGAHGEDDVGPLLRDAEAAQHLGDRHAERAPDERALGVLRPREHRDRIGDQRLAGVEVAGDHHGELPGRRR